MKKNDENQNSDSGLTRRIYKKANLDDTVVNIKKDSSDDFNLLSGDEMMDYVPGVDDVDHFDFDESDIEHYRKLNEQEAVERDRRRKQRAAEKQWIAQNQQRTENSGQRRISSVQKNWMNNRRKRDRINRPARPQQKRFL